jgi:ParB family chromosome partitioning protein
MGAGGRSSSSGVTALAPPVEAPAPHERVEMVPLARVVPSPLQPRKDFPAEALHELAESIREQGIIQPLLVRSRGDSYELIAGERRWRAAQSVGLQQVPVIVRNSDDRTVLELMLIENLQRENLNPIEEALGYQELIEAFDLTQDDVALRVGKSRAGVANALRLLKLAPDLQLHVRDGRLSVGHAKAILSLAGAQEQTLAGHRILKDGLNVRQTEALVAQIQARASQAAAVAAGLSAGESPLAVRDVHVADVEHRLQERLGTKVALRYRRGKGSIEIRFFTDQDLERVLQIIGVRPD